MKLTAIKTAAIRANNMTLLEFVDRYVSQPPEHSVVAISAKVVSLCEGRVVKFGDISKEELVRRESQYFLPPEYNTYGVMVTVNRDILIASAGIDESNGDGHYILWPEDPQASANAIRAHFREKLGYEVGVLLTDSRIPPMRRGTIGLGLAHSGFAALENYVGTSDVFGNYDLKYTYASIIDGLAGAAVVLMGEGAQLTPIVLIEDVDFVKFQDRNPSEEELAVLRVSLEEDMYNEMLKAIPWDKRPGKN
jgi:F420-0:gamma-glutamyl ligase